MTEQEARELYAQTKERCRRLGKENPADVIVHLASEINLYLSKIEKLEEEIDKLSTINRLYKSDIADRDKMLKQKVEDVYADFMRDYKCMREELDGAYEELAELRQECDVLEKELKETRRRSTPLTEKKEPTVIRCGSCKYIDKDFYTEPCCDCDGSDRWERKDGILP